MREVDRKYIICINCSKKFSVYPRLKRKYCSRICFFSKNIVWNKGVPMREHSKIKLRESLKGRIPWNKGLTKSDPRVFKNIFNMALSRKGCIGSMRGKKHSIETRKKLSDIQKGIRKSPKTEFKKGSGGGTHWHWKGGITALGILIRNCAEGIEWKKAILRRDGFCCTICKDYSKKRTIEVHHIKPFFIILKDFLNQYSQFSPSEDKETLLRLSFSYKDFWDLSNGKTLCKECHRKITRTSATTVIK